MMSKSVSPTLITHPTSPPPSNPHFPPGLIIRVPRMSLLFPPATWGMSLCPLHGQWGVAGADYLPPANGREADAPALGVEVPRAKRTHEER